MLVDRASATKSKGESDGVVGVNTESVETGEGGAILGEGIGGGVACGVVFGGTGTEGGGACTGLGVGSGGRGGGDFAFTFVGGTSPSAVSKIAPTLSAAPVFNGSFRILPILDL